ncbi:uncharacterized protein LOC108675007 isoform X1 [Hyalella azteca]|uniref:Uncharacterized protein LOC108675007 isoform X1 n=1 Tax=Hyalella azteca TaxID=294128 RepID=A0A8B7P068_HYAAZ|nr:uncharacterized protein LOC108675007 isoform X1 [Hyalella azteca]
MMNDSLSSSFAAERQLDLLELSAGENLEGYSSVSVNGGQGNHDELSTLDDNKERLRKVLLKSKKSQSRQKKKALTRNLKSFSAAELQQSVADFARGAGVVNDAPCLWTSFVNDPLLQTNIHPEQKPLYDVKPELLLPTSNRTVHTDEISVCIMDAGNSSYRMSAHDLALINEGLEKLMYKDLTMTSKLKICNSFLSETKHVWVICMTQFTANWVILKVREIEASNGRKLCAHLVEDLTFMTSVTMLVPKECGFVDGYASLMRFLKIHNPSLCIGITAEIPLSVKSRLGARIEMPVNGNYSEVNNNPNVDQLGASPQDTDQENPGNSESLEQPVPPCIDSSELQVPRRARSITFYADDVWVQELQQLGHGPFLGLRRLQYVLGDRNMVRCSDQMLPQQQLPHNKANNFNKTSNSRAGAGRRNRKKRSNAATATAGRIGTDSVATIPQTTITTLTSSATTSIPSP